MGRHRSYSTLGIAFVGLAFAHAAIAQSTRVVQSTSAVTAHPQVSVQAGADEKIVGGGAFADWRGHGSLLTQTEPDGATGWIAAAKDHLHPDPAAVTAYGIALSDPADLYEVIVRQNTSAPAAHPVAVAQLPPGYVMTGGGCRVNWKTSPGAAGNLLTASFPQTATIWECRAKDHMIPSPATLTAFVIGIKPRQATTPIPQLRIETATSGVSPHPEAIATRSDQGFVVTGGGARIDNGPPYATGGQLLTRSGPVTAGPGGPITGWAAKGKDHATPSPGSITAFVISLNFSGGTSLTGYQIVPGTPIVVGYGGRSVVARVPCPMGKVALGAAYSVTPVNTQANQTEVERGVEVKGARPVWPSPQVATQTFAEVSVRNANWFEDVTLTADAVCVDARPDIRIETRNDSVTGNTSSQAYSKFAECRADEVVIGGGAVIVPTAAQDEAQGWLKSNAPNDIRRRGWYSHVVHTGPSFNLRSITSAVCAAATSVSGWSIGVSGTVSLGAHAQVQQNAPCTRGTALIAGIEDDTTLTGHGMAPVSLRRSSTGSWTAKIHNRDALGAPASVVANTKAICADVRP